MGHPTGRLLLHRDPFPFDFDKVTDEAIGRGVAMEINGSPERLDLGATHVRAAKAKGAKFIVSTDAHHPKHLSNMRYGILTARRGGLAASDVLNTYHLERFKKALRH
jgi:DNA polymerase (family 10)